MGKAPWRADSSHDSDKPKTSADRRPGGTGHRQWPITRMPGLRSCPQGLPQSPCPDSGDSNSTYCSAVGVPDAPE